MLLRHASELPADDRPVCAAIGMFDGVHVGHQEIIQKVIAEARAVGGVSVVITFDAHPGEIVAPERAPALLQSLAQRIETIGALGAEALWVIHFDRAFSELSAEAFIRQMAEAWGRLRSLCIGVDFAFGHQRSGNVGLLRQLGAEIGFAVHGLPTVTVDGQPVSSTRIREAVRAGDFAGADRLLGRPYQLAGLVVTGDQLGRQLGFPTANLDVRGLVVPPNGVYATETWWRGAAHPSVTNIGLRPTLREPAPTLQVETHLLDFQGDLYGQELGLRFEARLREERQFASLAELEAQITQDAAAARRHFLSRAGN
jgi:riboflavin kinase/FMN adenylyltransferase